jgi:hypothetical protein
MTSVLLDRFDPTDAGYQCLASSFLRPSYLKHDGKNILPQTGRRRGYGPAGPRRPTRTLPLTEYTEPQSYIELRNNRICLKALLLGGRENPEQWGVNNRNTSKLVFLLMPLHKAFKPSYMSFSLWPSV